MLSVSGRDGNKIEGMDGQNSVGGQCKYRTGEIRGKTNQITMDNNVHFHMVEIFRGGSVNGRKYEELRCMLK